jgi:hypothetical protein
MENLQQNNLIPGCMIAICNVIFIIFASIHLLYRGFHCAISIHAYYVPWLSIPHHPTSSFPSPILRMIKMGFIGLFSYILLKFKKVIHIDSAYLFMVFFSYKVCNFY